MILLAAADVTPFFDPGALDAALASRPDSERAAVLSLRPPEARARRLGGYIVRDRLLRGLGIKGELSFSRHERGKPRLAEHPETSFSVAHSGHIALCAASDEGEIGADVEIIPSANAKVALFSSIATRYFGEAEQAEYFSSGDKLIDFFCLWTRKEALIKYRALPVPAELSSFDSLAADVGADFREYDLTDAAGNEYRAAVCVPPGCEPPASVEFIVI